MCVSGKRRRRGCCRAALPRLRSCEGQGTVEAAFALPILLVLVLLLVQPGIVLYDRMVMQAAAAEGCRVLATQTDAYGASAQACESFVRHRLASVPAQGCFHVHEGDDCSWRIELDGGEGFDSASVSIANRIKPLPLFDFGAVVLGIAGADGTVEISVSAQAPAQPAWAASSELGLAPREWVGAWSS